CWSSLQRDAGVELPAAGPQEGVLGDALGRLLHVDDPLRIGVYRRWCTPPGNVALSEAEERLLTGLMFTLWNRNAPPTLDDARTILGAHPAIVAEVTELMGLLEDRAEHLTFPLDDELRWA